MAYKKGKRTIKKLARADDKFTLLVDEVLKHIDIGVYESSRTTKRQMQMFKSGKSQIDGVKRLSKHQITKKYTKSRAIDCFPYKRGLNVFKMSMEAKVLWYEMNWHFYRASLKLNIPIRQGYLWSFKDFPHIELRG